MDMKLLEQLEKNMEWIKSTNPSLEYEYWSNKEPVNRYMLMLKQTSDIIEYFINKNNISDILPVFNEWKSSIINNEFICLATMVDILEVYEYIFEICDIKPQLDKMDSMNIQMQYIQKLMECNPILLNDYYIDNVWLNFFNQ